MVSVLIYMVTHWTRPMMSHDIVYQVVIFLSLKVLAFRIILVKILKWTKYFILTFMFLSNHLTLRSNIYYFIGWHEIHIQGICFSKRFLHSQVSSLTLSLKLIFLRLVGLLLLFLKWKQSIIVLFLFNIFFNLTFLHTS